MQITLRAARIDRVLRGLGSGVIVAALAAEALRHLAGVRAGLIRVFSPAGVSNLPSWYLMVLLLACAAACAALSSGARRRGEAHALQWGVLAGVLLLGSLNTLLRLQQTVARLAGPGPLPRLVGGVLTAVVAVALVAGLWRFGRRLPADLRRRLLLAAGLFVVGDLAGTWLMNVVAASHGPGGGQALVRVLREASKIAGATVLLSALVAHLAAHAPDLQVVVASGSRARPGA